MHQPVDRLQTVAIFSRATIANVSRESIVANSAYPYDSYTLMNIFEMGPRRIVRWADDDALCYYYVTRWGIRN